MMSLYYIQDKNCHRTEICFITDEAVEAEITRVESDPHEERTYICAVVVKFSYFGLF